MSASLQTITGALPPSSRWVRLRVRAAAWRIFWPVTISPVSDTMRTRGWLTSGLPTLSPPPQMTFSTPGGRISANAGASASTDSGVCSDGLNTTVLPAASAGAIFHAAIISG
ncbi:hypothetical protein D9M69_503870 [compost metagenome]